VRLTGHRLVRRFLHLATDHTHAFAAHNTLFRGNTVLTKIMELSMSFYGKAFLEASIGSVMRRLCAEKVAIEVDPLRSGKSLKDIERNVEQLIYWCQEFWKQIYSVRTECPQHVCFLTEMTWLTDVFPLGKCGDSLNIYENSSRNVIGSGVTRRIKIGSCHGRVCLLSASFDSSSPPSFIRTFLASAQVQSKPLLFPCAL
jgi:hypothetical protein